MTEYIMNVTTNNNIQCILALNNLRSVYDPEIGLNVVDLGLIYKIEFIEAEKRINIDMTLTTQFCPMGESIVDDVTKTMSNTFKDYANQVNLIFEPPWNHQRISEEGQQFLKR
jgi:metal-sulfur cluster biosynthetic enzyme